MVLNSFPFYRRALTGFFASAFLLAGVSGARAQTVIQDYYVPMPEQQIRTSFATLAPSSSAQIESVVSIVVAVAGTRVVYDHWEDGYEVNLNAPAQSTTRIWGDGNNANGIPPGFVNDPSSFSYGAVIALRNLVPLPRNPSSILYDGRDRVGATRGIVMSRSAWASPTPGPLLADATEIQSTIDWGTSYEIPVGQDVIFPTPLTSSMFEYVSVMVMAGLNNTELSIDTDGNGTTDITTTINQGESYQVHGGVSAGATVNSTKPVQVQVLTGDIGANYESRWFTIPSTDQWTPEYYAPVGTASDGDDTYIFLYNPNGVAIDVDYETQTGTGTFNVAAGATYRFLAPQNSGTRFSNGLDLPFFGVGTVGAEPTANNVHDWGFDLVPTQNLTPEIVVGWGPGSSDLTQNGSPVWVMPAAATTIYVDYNGDHSGPLTDPAGNAYDLLVSSSALQVSRVYEPDKDQTGMRLYTLDGTLITAAWGQDPAVAGPAMPYLDVGTTIPNFPVPTMIKTSELFVDAAPAGLSIGDTIRYRITLDNRGLVAIGNTIVTDTLPPALSYVNNSTTHDGTPIADSGATNFPLDETGYTIAILPRNSSTYLEFDAVIIASGSIVNTATGAGTSSSNVTVVPPGSTDPCTLFFTDSGGTTITAPNPGDDIYVTIDDSDANTNAGTAQTIQVTITNNTGGDIEVVTLTETGVNTGVFRNTVALPSSETGGLTINDGTLNMVLGDALSAAYTDPSYGDTCNDSVTVSPETATKILYLDADALDGDTTGDMDRVNPANPVDGTTSSTSTLAAPSAASVTVSGAATSGVVDNGQVVTFSHSTGSGSNRLLLVGVSFECSGGSCGAGPNLTINSVTFNTSNNLARLGRSFTSSGDGIVEIWYMFNPPASTTGNVVVTNSGTNIDFTAGAVTFAGVDQGQTLTGVGATGSSGTATVNVPSAVGNLVFDTVSFDSQGTTLAAGTGQTTAPSPYWNRSVANDSGNNGIHGGASSEAGAASVTMSWSNTTSSDWAILGVSIAPAAGTTGGSVSFTQTPAFCEDFILPLGGTVSAEVYYTNVSGTLGASPNVSAVLSKVSGGTVATSSGASANGSRIAFTFPALAAAATVNSGDALRLTITNNQSGVSFQVRYDSSTAPSFVSFDTTTVIHVDSVTVYDDAYPGGAVTASAANGDTLYVRTTVTDPFGSADITSLPFVIDGSGVADDISITLDDPDLVADNGCQKTFEYEWNTGPTTGLYTITATGVEGTEGTVTDSASTDVTLSALDLGTPCEHELTTGPDGSPTNIYAADEQICVRITDYDENVDTGVAETLSVELTSGSGDVETFSISETGVNTGVFAGCIPASSTVAGTSGNGTLYVPTGTAVTGSYTDPDDASDTCTDSGAVPGVTPAVAVIKSLVSPADGIAVVGESVQYHVSVTNIGNSVLPTIALDDTFPSANLTYVSATPNPNSTGVGTLHWNDLTGAGSLGIGDTIDVVVNFTALASSASAVNSVTADAGGGVNDTDTEPVTITDPSLLVTKTLVSPSPGPAGNGDPVVFEITVENTGDTTISTLPLEDTYSGACFDYVSSTLAPDATGYGSILWDDITGGGSLAPTGTITIQITLEAAGACNPATNTASVDFVSDDNGDLIPPDDDDATIVTQAVTISGFVYDDEGAAGFGGDDPLAGVTVTLYTDPDGDGDPSDGVVVGYLETLVDGSYEFTNLPLGNYVVVETDPIGFTSIDDTEGAAADNRIAVVAVAYITYPNNNFLDDLIDPADYGSISGQVRNDVDWDGDFGDVESGIDGVTIDLYQDPNGDGDLSDGVLFLSTTTSGGGNYSFPSIPPGDYIVVETDPTGYYSTADVDSPNDNQVAVTLPAAGNETGNDFLDSQDCTVDADCTDALFCNGTETCVANVCTAGTNPCTGGPDCADTCYEAADNCFDPAATACGSSSDTVCDNPDTCNGTGTCLPNNEPNTTTCRADAGQCDVAETCDGAGSCPADAFEPNTTSCIGASQGGVCDGSDVCSGTANTCVDVYLPNTTTCRADAGQCDVAETCTGSSGACPADTFEPNTAACTGASQAGVCDNDAADRCTGTANTCVDAYQPNTTTCRADAGQCDVAETCTGSSGACPADAFEPNSTACTGASQGDVCDGSDVCSGTANTCVDVYLPNTTTCRADAGQCDVAETCTGSSGACPADAFEPNTTACTGASQAGVCDNDAADVCSGTANTCVDAYQPNTTTCRADAGQCDVAETCTGSSGACPADAFEPNTTSCTGTSQAGVCDNDAADVCSGTANTCVDVYQPNTTTCRADAGQCDVAETCTGSSGACPADTFEPNTTACTGASQGGVCDGSDACSGTANTCVDAYLPNTTTCRADAGQCDVAETCTGSSGACPADTFEPNTTACTGASQGGVCDGSDACSGTANTCVDAYLPNTTTCRADAGQCDVAETCTGSSGACPADAFEPNTTACTGTSQAGVCDNDAADRCTGTSTACVDAYLPNTTTCRADAGLCDVAETCTGSSGACPANVFEPNGTSCNDLAFCNGVDTCSAGTCVSAGDPCGGFGCDELNDMCLLPIDLSVTKTDLSDPVIQGGTLVYSITVENAGPAPATNVVVTDTLDPDTTYVSNTGGCTHLLGVLTCNYPVIANGGSQSFTVTVTVGAAAPTGSTLRTGACNGTEDLCNTIVVTATETDTDPSNDADDEPTDVEVPGPTALVLTKTDLPDPVAPGGTLTYTLNYSNVGPDPLLNAQIIETYDVRTTFVSASPPPDFGNNTWVIGDLDPGETGTIIITTTVNGALADGTVLNNHAILSADLTPSVTVDEPTTVRVNAAGTAALGILKTVSPSVAPAGALLTYTVTASNGGPGTSYDTIVSDALPAGLTYMNAIPAPALVLGNYIEWNAGDLPAGASVQFVVYAETVSTLDAGTLIENCAEAAGATGPGTVASAGLSAQGCATASITGAGQDCRLVMTKRGVGIAQPGGEIVYRCLWCDPCVDAPSVFVVDDLPPEVEFVSVSSRDMRGYQLTDNSGLQQLVLDIGVLPKGRAGIAYIRTRVKDNVAPGTIVSNEIRIEDAAGRTQSDTDLTTIGTGVASELRGLPTLRVTGNTRAKSGGSVQYMARYSNLAPGSTAMVTLTDTINPTYVSPAPTTRSTRSLVWKGLSGSGIIKVKGKTVMSDPSARGGVVSVEAMVTGPDGGEVVKAGVDTALLASTSDGGGSGGSGSGGGGDTPAAGSSGKASLTAPSFVRAGLTSTLMLRYSKLVGASKASMTVPEGVGVDSTFPRASSIEGNVIKWDGLAATSGILKVTIVVPEEISPGASLTVGATVTDEAGAVGLERTMGVR